MTKLSPKNPLNFRCEKCDYNTSNKKDYNKHILTGKHKLSVLSLTNNDNKISKNPKIFTCDCGKEYKYRQGLHTHKKTCNFKKPVYNIDDNFQQTIDIQNKLIIELLKDNKQHELFLELFKDNKEIKDLEETGRLGFADGISKIFINGLKQLELYDRPLHCNDAKREVLYIKSDDKWAKEDDNKPILTKAIKDVANKNMKQIYEWQKVHKEFSDPDSKQNDKYLQIVSESMSGSSKEESEKNYDKIIKKLVKQTIIPNTEK